MPEELVGYEDRRSFNDGEWEAHYVIGKRWEKRLALVIEQTTRKGKNVVSVPLSPQHARAVIRLLHKMLAEAGEPTGVRPSDEQPDGSWVLDRSDTVQAVEEEPMIVNRLPMGEPDRRPLVTQAGGVKVQCPQRVR